MQNSAGALLQFELYPPLFTSNIEFYSNSNVKIGDWLVSRPMSTVRLFLGSALTNSFGIACTGYTFDRSAFNVLFQKVRGLGFTLRVYV